MLKKQFYKGTSVRFLAFTLLIVSLPTFGRELACEVIDEMTPTSILLHGTVSLDKRPNPASPADTIAASKNVVEKPMTFNGKSGVLKLSMSATYYQRHPMGHAGTITNTGDKFPRIDVGAFFHEETTPPEQLEATVSEISVRFQGTPTINPDMSRAAFINPGRYGIWAAGKNAWLSCTVLD